MEMGDTRPVELLNQFPLFSAVSLISYRKKLMFVIEY